MRMGRKTLFRIILPLLIIFPNISFAGDTLLTGIFSKEMKRQYYIFLRTNDRNLITGVMVKKSLTDTRHKFYPIQKFYKPASLVKVLGKKIITLQCTDINTASGCGLVIKYPYNLVTGNYKQFTARIKRDGRKWYLSNRHGVIKSLHLKKKALIGILVGIKEIRPEYKPKKSTKPIQVADTSTKN